MRKVIHGLWVKSLYTENQQTILTHIHCAVTSFETGPILLKDFSLLLQNFLLEAEIECLNFGISVVYKEVMPSQT